MNDKTNFDSSSISNELKFLLDCLKSETNKQVPFNVEQNLDWNLFLKLARHHRVYPLIYKKLKYANYIPAPIIQSMYYDYQKNTFKMLKLSGEIERISRVVFENEISTLFLKGPILAADLYGGISQRTSSDVDILVNIDDLKKIESLLIQMGYVKDEYIQTVLNDWKWRHHHFVYFHTEKEIKLEIHWRLNPGPAKEPTFNELWLRKRVSSLTTSYPIYCLGNEDLFLFLASHGARHGWSRLRWLVDIDRLCQKKLDWDKIISLLKKYQYMHVAGQTLVLTSQMLNTPINKEVNDLTLKYRSNRLAQEALFYIQRFINLHDEPLSEEIASYHKKHLFSLMSFQNKLLFVLSFLHPYFEDTKTLPLPQKFHFLYFPLRPFLWFWRKTRIRNVIGG
ncbi:MULTISPECIES: nucleotidyltransferase family protein [unclassified Bacillus (in: firmicutes)]|uniref:nucleotidyltransferase domain-containing protein n=1 Tax=unclassified Bacillus (in: firmicutes) TaxID=185979 RepID=UPI001BEBF600|nr:MULTISPECIES: nucleotidyltransferase family protein [unclassified Bacillus (in: firmicutes)]MBT2616219.1 nucleotidyltransferase family protein [Bacillus sp. ISL-78]MBT2628995.1 nucleotidyltransferase family protein [Bacillus sp. ISL-101]MBT2714942.1 nucleotidyltransferase family protein [Bacillus sp. ISL-57]